MFFRVKLAILFSTLNAPTIFACVLTVRKASFRGLYDRSPHCHTVSQTGLSSFILAEIYLLCGVGIIHLDNRMISYLSRGCNGDFLQFFLRFLGILPIFLFAPRSCRYARKTVEQKQAGGLSHQGKRVQMKELSLRTSDRCHLWQSVSPLKCSNY